MSRSADRALDALWDSAPARDQEFDPARLASLPVGARRYLQHAIAPEAPLASAVRLKMHGEIKLKGWYRFSAEEVISWERGMTWRAHVRSRWMSIRGGDSFLGGQAAMRWKLFGVVALIDASGPDVSRSAAGRVNAECVWLPSALCAPGVQWTAEDDTHVRARFTAHGEPSDVSLVLDDGGRLQSMALQRWGNPGGSPYRYEAFGGVVEQEGRFGAYTIPTRMRAGWFAGTERFASQGEFFRVTIDDAVFR